MESVKRFKDLSERSYRNNQFTFTPFLGLSDISDFYEQTKYPKTHEMALAPSGYTVYGGYENAERCMIRFGNEEELMYEQPFPIVCITVEPLQKKFADELTHRDFLGALINLGIERSELGDILVRDKSCYVFATETMAEVICRDLTRVKHTSVMAKVCEPPKELIESKTENGQLQAKSLRIDGIVAKLCNLSRSKSAELFLSGKVFVDGRLMENESHQLKAGDTLAVRGYGKYKIVSTGGVTRKGNLIIEYERYV